MKAKPPKLKRADIIARTWFEMMKEPAPPPMPVIDQMLEDHQSWLPAEFLAMRSCNPRAANLFTYHAYGKFSHFPNQRFAELFETAEEIDQRDLGCAQSYDFSNLMTGVDGKANRKCQPTELMHRLCANSDQEIFFADMLRDALGKQHESPSCFVSSGVYCLNTREKTVRCMVTRMPFLGDKGEVGGLYLSIEPLPDSMYLRDIPAQNVGFGQPEPSESMNDVDPSTQTTTSPRVKVEPGTPTPRKRARPSDCLLYTSPSPRDRTRSRMPSSA
eukprot:TRINITY_DN1380_c0_g3_i2.p1 TRINITY_DN1380_c0_g3~~TRINITY_DN1380_c0_g3_i2.p1  ORF type:complete len:273 (+),score=57.69 TRINITY_DN1380_c0_g3_i2:3-821(+)